MATSTPKAMVLGLGFRVGGLGFGDQDLGFREWVYTNCIGFRSRVLSASFGRRLTEVRWKSCIICIVSRLEGLGFKLSGLRFRIQGLGHKVQSLITI